MQRVLELLTVNVEVDFYFGLGGLRAGCEAPMADRRLRGWGQKSVSGLNLCGRYGPIGLDGDEKYDLAAHVHAASEFRVRGRDAGDDGPVDGRGEGCAHAGGEASCQEKMARGA